MAGAINGAGENPDDSDANELQAQLQHSQEILKVLQRRRDVIELQLAKFGMNTPPEISVEIEDLEERIGSVVKRIAQIQAELKNPNTSIQKSIDNPSIATPDNMFIPLWSVLRSRVQYVDANLALKYADAAQDVSIMLGFATLFLGSAISFAVSLVAADKPTDTILLGTATAFSILLTIIFALLTIRSWIRAEASKKSLFESGDSTIGKDTSAK